MQCLCCAENQRPHCCEIGDSGLCELDICGISSEIDSRGAEGIGLEQLIQPRNWCDSAQGKNAGQIENQGFIPLILGFLRK
ncbi:unnamed protein product [Ilex paraguariensis]|uniref:Uncharacterized protein n=1 Tax=Ilex paraguariensis TaxID=185542 RepID=A0ABC8SWJ2_9AQUA